MITKMEVFSARPNAPELSLGGTLASDDPVQIRDIQGLGPVKAAITTTPFATSKGVLYQGSTVGARNIVLTLGLNPDWEDQTIASLRQLLYAYLLPEAWCKLRFYSDLLPTVDIEGYVESNEPNIFSRDPEVQISIICPKPDFIDIDATIFTGLVDDGTNEHVIDYIGTVPTGLELRVDRTVANPSYTGSLGVYNNAINPQTFKVDPAFQINPVTIDTTKYFKLSTIINQKRAQNVAVLDAAVTNLLANVTGGSAWPQLFPGENLLSVVGEESGQAWTLAYFNRFGGL